MSAARRRGRRIRRAVAVGLAAVAMAVPGRGLAQGFFQVSPGPLARGHAKLDGLGDCTTCHVSGRGVSDERCLGCHDHQPLRQRIAAGKGPHAKWSREKRCADCHRDHKGREQSLVDWDRVGGRKRFDHRLTGYPLRGRHATLGCNSCHQAKMPVSGTRTYLGLSTTCSACHENVHRFTAEQTRLMACESCHSMDARRVDFGTARLAFDHDRDTRFKISRPHSGVACTQCHDGLVFRFQTRSWEDCRACHPDPHETHFTKDRACTKCHAAENRKFTDTRFDHDRDTKFVKEGAHRRARCEQCHAKGREQKPKTTCSSCHGDPHADRYASLQCQDCHDPKSPEGFRARLFDHGRKTKFALTGRHAQIACQECHRPTQKRRPLTSFEKHSWRGQCMDCHRHERAHRGQFRKKDCTSCHKEGGSRELTRFEHNRDSRFPLVGFHTDVKCHKCHPGHGTEAGKYRDRPLVCKGCHDDGHGGQLGDRCSKCHSPQTKYQKNVLFDHDLDSVFPLHGKHREVKCEKCHPKELIEGKELARYKPIAVTCITCHKEQDAHLGRLGEKCEDCHDHDGFKGFRKRHDHARATGFALTGAHEKSKCEDCHPPVPGTPEGKILFQTAGRECADCHGDPHGVGPSGAAWCGACHDDRSFRGGDFAGRHGSGPVPLAGIHADLDCRRCHAESVVRTGASVRCGSCHQPDDVHQGALGQHCADCHGQRAFSPSTFQHLTTGFPLLGRHRMVACEDCHRGGNFGALSPTCFGCHERDYLAAAVPRHFDPRLGALYDLDCAACHTERMWRPAVSGGGRR